MKTIILTILLLVSFLLGDPVTKKALVTTIDDVSQVVIVVAENMDSLKINLLGSTFSIAKINIKSITYLENQFPPSKQDKNIEILSNLQMIEASRYNPLKNKKYGLETSMMGLLTVWQKTGYWSAGFSMFSLDRNAEINLPVTYCWDGEKDPAGKNNSFITGLHYRRFFGSFGDVQNGFYVSALVSYARVKATQYDTTYTYNPLLAKDEMSVKHNNYDKNLSGLGFGVGYRRFSTNGWYWGVGLTVSRYLAKRDKIIYSSPFGGYFGSAVLLDFELLKFGWAF